MRSFLTRPAHEAFIILPAEVRAMPTYFLVAFDGRGLEELNGALVAYQFQEGVELTNLGVKVAEEDVGDGVSLRQWAESKLREE